MTDLMPQIAVIHGPNLNLLGRREPEIYGRQTLADWNAWLIAEGKSLGCAVDCFQSNHEGALVDHIHSLAGNRSGIVINAAGLTHTSVVLRDALLGVALPFVEVHISNVHAREAFRHRSFLADVALAVISGCGGHGYRFGLETILRAL